MSVEQASARDRIDQIDEALLRLIDERAGLTISAGMGADPGLEALALRRLLSLPRASVHRPLIVRVWRELMADAVQRQVPRHLSVWGAKEPLRTAELARHRFGSSVSLTMTAKAEDALAAARTPGAIGILALSGDHPWWLRLLAEPSLQVFAALPDMAVHGPLSALAVGQVAAEPTGADETYFVTDRAGSAGAVQEALAKDGVAAELVTQAGGFKLFALAGFYQRSDPRLAKGPGRLFGVIGASPTALDV
jgi:chorismate mutase